MSLILSLFFLNFMCFPISDKHTLITLDWMISVVAFPFLVSWHGISTIANHCPWIKLSIIPGQNCYPMILTLRNISENHYTDDISGNFSNTFYFYTVIRLQIILKLPITWLVMSQKLRNIRLAIIRIRGKLPINISTIHQYS